MGREQRSRRRLPDGTLCYLCAKLILADQQWDRDHVPPKCLYGKAIRQLSAANLRWLHSHRSCNAAFSTDEAYFHAAFSGNAETPAGRAAFSDFGRGVRQGHNIGLVKAILDQFSQVTLADGTLLFQYDDARVTRVIWKLVRGIYFEELERVLPDTTSKRLFALNPDPDRDPAEKYPLFDAVRRTLSLGGHPEVFDYKWLAVVVPEMQDARMHAIAMLFWDSMAWMMLFHDPTCPCGKCHTEEGSRQFNTVWVERPALPTSPARSPS